MELSSEESIRAFVRAYEHPTRTQRPHGAQDTTQRVSRGRRVRCKCGQCHQCLEGARWERIFAEKFADPNYYTSPVVRYSSPLLSF